MHQVKRDFAGVKIFAGVIGWSTFKKNNERRARVARFFFRNL